MRLETDRLILRQWRLDDAKAYIALQGDATVRRFFAFPMSAEQAREDLNAHMEKQQANGFHYCAAELKDGGDFVGLIGLGKAPDIIRDVIPSRPEVEIGWVINRRFWGQGLAPEGARACLAYGWEVLQLPEVVAFTARVNTPSQRVMKKIGMTYDPADDYQHPRIEAGHALCPHVVYRIKAPAS